MLECVVNVSEGRRVDVIDRLVSAGGGELLDVHHDPDHHRTVLTLVGEDAPRRVARQAVESIDLRNHTGAHPRLGALDVVPFVPLGASTMDEAVAARDSFAAWAGAVLSLPCFHYGPERSLPDVRRRAFADLGPDAGPPTPHPTAGACAVGAREILVAYNLWLHEPDLGRARDLARELRGPSVRALGLQVGPDVQVSTNLVDPASVGPDQVYDRVAGTVAVARAELVGLAPASVLASIPRARWNELDLAEDRTIESRLEARGLGRL